MKTVIGYVINTFRWNSMATFGILGVLSLYTTLDRYLKRCGMLRHLTVLYPRPLLSD